jgi:heme oxygenase
MTTVPAIGVGPLSLRLREGTREAHEQVERAAAFNRLVVVRIPDAGAMPARERERALAEYREVYRRFLIAAHGFEAAADRRFEGSAARAAATASGFPAESIDPVRMLVEDLARLAGPGALAALPVMEDLPEAHTLPELAGMEYVRRGSRAGGAVIGAVVRANLGLGPADGASFLGCYGSRTRSVIQTFKDWLDRLPFDEGEMARAVAAATRTFEAVERWHLRLEASPDWRQTVTAYP